MHAGSQPHTPQFIDLGFEERVTLRCVYAQKKATLLASLFPLTSPPTIRSRPLRCPVLRHGQTL